MRKLYLGGKLIVLSYIIPTALTKQKFKDSDSSYQNHLCNDVKNKVLHPFYNFLTMEIRTSKFIETHI